VDGTAKSHNILWKKVFHGKMVKKLKIFSQKSLQESEKNA